MTFLVLVKWFLVLAVGWIACDLVWTFVYSDARSTAHFRRDTLSGHLKALWGFAWKAFFVVAALVFVASLSGCTVASNAVKELDKPVSSAFVKATATVVPEQVAPPSAENSPAPAVLSTETPVSAPAVTDPTTEPVSGRPTPWMADNGQSCNWGVPAGTVLNKQTVAYVFTNCMSFNLRPNKSLQASWNYSQADYDFLMSGEKGADGIAWWGPLSGSTAVVSYNGGPSCTGRSFAVVPGVQIQVTFTNGGQDTMATWSQGNWGVALNKLYKPECMPGDSKPNAEPAKTPVPTQAATKAPAPDKEMLSTKKATYGPISFVGNDAFMVQHLGNWVFHLNSANAVALDAPNFKCTWIDNKTGKVEPPWGSDHKVTCVPVKFQ